MAVIGNNSEAECECLVPPGDWSPGWLGAENVFQQDPSRQVLGRIHLDVKASKRENSEREARRERALGETRLSIGVNSPFLFKKIYV